MNKRIFKIKLSTQERKDEKIEISLTKPVSAIIFKSRKIAYEINIHDIPFIILFYYIHGPIDKGDFSA